MDRANDQGQRLAAPFFAIVFLPCGIRLGFVGVTLSYILAQRGVSVAAIAGLSALGLLSSTWQFFFGPLVDMSFTPKRWYLATLVALSLCMAAFAVAPLTAASMPLLSLLSLIAGLSGTLVWSAGQAVMANTTPVKSRGAAAGWTQASHMGGASLGGGLGLWLALHGGGPRVAIAALALVCLACALPVLLTAVAHAPSSERLTSRMRGVGAEIWDFARTRKGVLTIIVLLLPADMGAAIGLLPTVASHWGAGGDLVALTGGALAGLTVMPGCLLAGHLCTRFIPRSVYLVGSLVFGLGEAAMAFAPHTPFNFGLFVLLNSFLAGAANAPYSAVIYDCLGPRAAATLGSLLASLGQAPLVIVTLVVGAVETARGADAMLYAEAAMAIVSVAAFAVLAALWRPTPIAGFAVAPT
jgi:MFS transporter, PAT family, beta-lactamase induction signal transducer AmpG